MWDPRQKGCLANDNSVSITLFPSLNDNIVIKHIKGDPQTVPAATFDHFWLLLFFLSSWLFGSFFFFFFSSSFYFHFGLFWVSSLFFFFFFLLLLLSFTLVCSGAFFFFFLWMTGMGPTNSVKNIEWWCQTGVVFKVMSDKWRKLSNWKKQTKQGLIFRSNSSPQCFPIKNNLTWSTWNKEKKNPNPF